MPRIISRPSAGPPLALGRRTPPATLLPGSDLLMRHRLRAGVYSFGEFLELVSEDEKADLLHGGIYMASPESLDHNDLVRWLTSVLSEFTEERNLGRVTVNKVAFRLSDDSAPEPDIGFISTARLDRLRSG